MDPILEPGIADEQKNKLIAKFPILTDADFFYEEGVGHDMLKLMESKLKKTRKELREIIAGL